ncbi:acyl-CoA dehydrogenase family protein [Streptomyces sp. NPDC094149]|uniref:acyl-CoA dehydrogenase family protein n=1 Tax=Streptomyces sp. NPDC094149 TaxID=3155079 RepID=UPI00331D639E
MIVPSTRPEARHGSAASILVRHRSRGTPAGARPLRPHALGLARGALAEFTERINRRGITYTFHTRQHEAGVTHLQAAEAAMKISCAELPTRDFVARVEAGGPYPQRDRARIRAQTGYVARLCKEAVDLIASASGASSLHREVPIQRAVRDVQALNLHSFVNPATNLDCTAGCCRGWTRAPRSCEVQGAVSGNNPVVAGAHLDTTAGTNVSEKEGRESDDGHGRRAVPRDRRL